MLPRVDFYVSAEAGEPVRLHLACRIAEKAYLAKQCVVVFCEDPALLPKIDDLLWTFGAGTFIPHDTINVSGATCDSPVALTTGPLPAGHTDVLINLGTSVPSFFENFARVAEFLDARPEVRTAGRERFKTYRARSIEPATHNVTV